MTLDRVRIPGGLIALGSSLCVAFMFGCPATPDAPDASTDAASLLDAHACTAASECDDGLACNGEESCTAGRCTTGMPIRCDDGIACTTDSCSEEMRGCVNRPVDADGDGSAAITCVDARGAALGTDCNDDDRTITPGALEVCDAAGRDEDCNPATHGGIDVDGDGFEDARCCNGTGAGACGTDCNDALQSANTAATETCNGIDDDCDGMIDEGVRITVYPDLDGDGRGVMAGSISACASTPGYALFGDDCDDADRMNSPVLPEVCDARDNDCDRVPDPTDITVSALWYRDEDGDGFGNPAVSILSCTPPAGAYVLLNTDCNDDVAAINPAQAERCNGLDDDCNGVADFVIAPGDLEDDDRDGIADSHCTPLPVPADCDDRDGTSGPGAPESCDGRDNDCDARIDEEVAAITYYRDVDADGYGSATSGSIVGCIPIAGHSARGGDCDDASFARHPGASEGCNATDEDCDGGVDEAPADDMCTSVEGSERTCAGGMCRAFACSPGFADCLDNHDGCETFTETSIAHCGGCGHPCNSEPNTNLPRCAARSCLPLTCASGFNDCDFDLGSGGNGCETSGACGGCGGGPACAEDQDCVAGSCVTCTPRVITLGYSASPPVPAGLKLSCFTDGSASMETDCPVVECGVLRTWAYSDADNFFVLGMVTYRPDGTIVRNVALPGNRYVWRITLDGIASANIIGHMDRSVPYAYANFRLP